MFLPIDQADRKIQASHAVGMGKWTALKAQ
ncbi:MAG: hypothetical protein JWN70_3245 [Planctomycetaceae bacterium]|nr:hypothetical protein [Planctomycetaceae bacterium]